MTACSKPKPEEGNATPPTTTGTVPPPSAGGGDATAKANEIFALRCTPCHGAEGRGDGVASKALVPPPRNFHDPEWQKAVTDDHIQKIIQYGGAAVGKSPAMPGNPDLSDAAVVGALRAKIRAFGGQ